MEGFKDNFSDFRQEAQVIYRSSPLPVFQNMFYAGREEAQQADKGEIALVQHPGSGFVFNSLFDPGKLDYKGMYNNEQAFSEVFQGHLDEVFSIFSSAYPPVQKVVEIGAGKGAFWDMLTASGYDCIGYDPAYDGDDPRIRKEYFTSNHRHPEADVFVLRHTLEHIQHPFSFVHTIAKSNDYRGSIFIEVPTLEWILKKKAFWDIFYEHVNYFTPFSLGQMFSKSTCLHVFGGQYILFHAHFSDLKPSIGDHDIKPADMGPLMQSVRYWKEKISQLKDVAIWGAGGKGSTFLNIIDPAAKYVRYAVDINPHKQNKYIGGTGHEIISPESIRLRPAKHIIVMNENYLDEVRYMLAGLPVSISSL